MCISPRTFSLWNINIYTCWTSIYLYHSVYTFLYTYYYLLWNWLLIFGLCLLSTFGWLFRPLNWYCRLPTKQCVLIIYLHVEIHGVDVIWYNSITHKQIWTHWSLLLDIIINLPNHDTPRHNVPDMDALAMEVLMF